jgi:hypothetical protein
MSANKSAIHGPKTSQLGIELKQQKLNSLIGAHFLNFLFGVYAPLNSKKEKSNSGDFRNQIASSGTVFLGYYFRPNESQNASYTIFGPGGLLLMAQTRVIVLYLQI